MKNDTHSIPNYSYPYKVIDGCLYEDDEFYYLLNDAAHQAVKKLCEDQGELFAISSRSLPKALADENLIDCGDGENTKSIRVGANTKRVVALYKERARKIVEAGMA